MFKPDANGEARAAHAWRARFARPGGGFIADLRFAGGTPVAETPAARPADRGADADAEVQAAAQAEAHRAQREAFEAGLAHGSNEARAQIAAERAAHAKLRLAFAAIDETMQRQLAERLAQTVIALCETAMTPYALDSEALQRRCLAAAAMLGEAQEQLELHLHPEDIASLDPAFAAGWTIVAAPQLERGTVRVEGAEAGMADGPAQWRAALEAAFGC